MTEHRPASFLLVLFLVACLLLPLGVASANAPAPPDEIWLTFVSPDQQAIELAGIQILGCLEASCTDPILLCETGNCSASNCVSGPPQANNWPERVQCHDNRCVFTSYSQQTDVAYFQMVVQTEKGALRSTIGWPLPVHETAATLPLEVILEEGHLTMQTDINFEEPRVVARSFWVGLAITLASELAVATLWSLLRTRQSIPRRLLMVFLVNLGTLPVVWKFFPSLAPFTTLRGDRALGLFVLVLALVYCLLLVWIFRAQSTKTTLTRVILSVVTLVVSLVVAAFATLIWMYSGAPLRAASGLTPLAILISAELFAWLSEALLYFFMDGSKLPFTRALELAFLANAASLGLGLWLQWL